MISQEQADTAQVFHKPAQAPCDGRLSNRWRRNGKTARWKREPQRWMVPVKFGLYDYAVITDLDAEEYHTEEDCPSNG